MLLLILLFHTLKNSNFDKNKLPYFVIICQISSIMYLASSISSHAIFNHNKIEFSEVGQAPEYKSFQEIVNKINKEILN